MKEMRQYSKLDVKICFLGRWS